MKKIQPADIHSLDLGTLLSLAELKAVEERDGHLTLLRFTTGWKAMVGTPNMYGSEAHNQIRDLESHPNPASALTGVILPDSRAPDTEGDQFESRTEMLESSVWHLLDMLNLVLHEDWEFSKSNLDNFECFVGEKGTFLYPDVLDESTKWGNRGCLLNSIRKVEALLDWQPHMGDDEDLHGGEVMEGS